MDNYALLLLVGFLVGAMGTLIGAGGGFILVPVLILSFPGLSPELLTAVSMAVVAANALSGTIAYARLGRIDYRAGAVFALAAIPGSIAGVYSTRYFPTGVFHIVFGILLIAMAFSLFGKKQTDAVPDDPAKTSKNRQHRILVDSAGVQYTYHYNQSAGIFVSLLVGYISPLLGIGGGIIHVPFLVRWLHFPVYIATATSHFILAIMALVSVGVHIINGNYQDPVILRMVLLLGAGALGGAQLGAWLSHKINGSLIIRILAVCLGLVGIRILLSH